MSQSGLGTLTRDIEAKQALIDRLQTEVDQHVVALKRITSETMGVKNTNAKLEAEIDELQRALDSFPSQVVLSPQALFEASRDDVMISHVGLLQRHKLAVQRNKDELTRIQSLQNKLIAKNEVETQMLRTRQAHTAQKAFRKSLEAKIAEGALLKATAKRQEKAIAQLEKLIEQNAKAPKPKKRVTIVVDDDLPNLALAGKKAVASPAFSMLLEENKVLQLHIDRLSVRKAETDNLLEDEANLSLDTLRERIRAETLKIKLLEQSAREQRPEDELAMLTRQAEDAERRGQALEEQLLREAKVRASEISAAEIRLLEAKTVGGYRPEAKFKLGGIGSTA